MKKNIIKPVIFIADDFHKSGIILLNKYFNTVNIPGFDNNALIDKISSNEITEPDEYSVLIVRSVRKIDKHFILKLKKKTNVKLVCTVSTGYDNIDADAAAKAGIDVMNVAGANSISAAEFTFSLLLAINKNLLKADKQMKTGKFNSGMFSNSEINGKTIGIIGVGRIGSKVASYARAFNMKILGNDISSVPKRKYKFIKFVSLNKLLSLSDYITIHTPLDESTRYLLNKSNITLCKKTSVIINCSRGGTINETDLLNALKKNKISYAGVDVFENEPGINNDFLKHDNVIITPHLAGKTIESKERMAVTAAEKIIKYAQNPYKHTALLN